MMSKCGLASDDDDRIDYSYGHLRDVWYYLYNKDTPGNVNKVTSFCVVILAKVTAHINIITILSLLIFLGV
jgi:hypothetical protein